MSVMNVKRSTQAFSKAEQTSAQKSDPSRDVGAGDFQKMFGEQAVGDVANKITDPNWVDPNKKVRTIGNNQLDKDAFLKLMLTQMKYQDPTNPMQSHEMASQLAQFTSLEQLNNINSTLESMKNSQSPNTNFQALAFIGKKASGDSSKLTRTAGDTKHAFNFEMLGDAAKVKVAIKDAGGNVIRNLEFTNMKKGSNSIEWNGLSEDGMPARPGEYKFTIEGQASNGAKVFSKTSFEGRITGLNYTAEGPILMLGNQSIKLSDVKKIEDPVVMAGSPAPTMALPLKAGEQEPEAIPPAEDPEVVTGNIDDVPMSRELINQLAKAK